MLGLLLELAGRFAPETCLMAEALLSNSGGGPHPRYPGEGASPPLEPTGLRGSPNVPEPDARLRRASSRHFAGVIAITLGFLLLAAALLKAHDLAFGAAPEAPHSSSRFLVVLTLV